MLRIRKLHDTVSSANMDAVSQVLKILKIQLPDTPSEDLEKLPLQLHDPLKYRYRAVLFVAENAQSKLRGFAMMLHLPDIGVAYLDLISTAPEFTGKGMGAILYERIREECQLLNLKGLFFECSVDDPEVVKDPKLLAQNRARLKFYEHLGVRPIANNDYATPVFPGDKDLYYLMVDGLGSGTPIGLKTVRSTAKAVLERKYGDIIPPERVKEIVSSFRDDPVRFRPPKYFRKTLPEKPAAAKGRPIPVIVNEGHVIHHVKARGYVEVPVRVSVILEELEKTGRFIRRMPKKTGEKALREVHDPSFVSYLHRLCGQLPADKSVYPIIFPAHNPKRPPRDLELQVGYYCTDTFTPLNRNAWIAARGAVDCAVTGAELLVGGEPLVYALVRPPGHHAERASYGGFCYLNSTAVAAQYLSRYGKVAVLDIDFHHGNGTQDIFYRRSDVFTASIHGTPRLAYPHFAGFADEKGEGPGSGFNLNIPLPESITPERYREALKKALGAIKRFDPAFLVLAFGLDTAKADPTGTWTLVADDFFQNGTIIRGLQLPVLVVQEGGYRTRTLGLNARSFLTGLDGKTEKATEA